MANPTNLQMSDITEIASYNDRRDEPGGRRDEAEYFCFTCAARRECRAAYTVRWRCPVNVEVAA